MKKLLYFFVGILLVAFVSCNCNEAKVPKNVTAAFSEMFPDATNVKWELEDNNEWEANFTSEGKELTVCFTDAGEWLETEWEVSKDELTEVIFAALNSTYEGWEIDEVEFVESPEFTGYEFELEMGEEEMEVLVTADGIIIVTEMDDEELDEE